MSLLCIPAKFEKQNHKKKGLERAKSRQAHGAGHQKAHGLQ